MQVQPYLFFHGTCEKAVEFYRTALGAEVLSLMRYSDSPEAAPPEMCKPGNEDWVMHAAFRIGESTVMASDDPVSPEVSIKGFSLSLSVPNDAEAERLFGLLAEGGQVQMPLGKSFFSSSFGMLVDRFGVAWMVVVMAQ
jgi:PhnB protein